MVNLRLCYGCFTPNCYITAIEIMDDNKKVYCSYLLRIWIEPTDGEKWRFSLEDTRTGKRQGFASLVKMMFFLNELTENDCRILIESD
jgi:hypothetical protein